MNLSNVKEFVFRGAVTPRGDVALIDVEIESLRHPEAFHSDGPRGRRSYGGGSFELSNPMSDP